HAAYSSAAPARSNVRSAALGYTLQGAPKQSTAYSLLTTPCRCEAIHISKRPYSGSCLLHLNETAAVQATASCPTIAPGSAGLCFKKRTRDWGEMDKTQIALKCSPPKT